MKTRLTEKTFGNRGAFQPRCPDCHCQITWPRGEAVCRCRPLRVTPEVKR